MDEFESYLYGNFIKHNSYTGTKNIRYSTTDYDLAIKIRDGLFDRRRPSDKRRKYDLFIYTHYDSLPAYRIGIGKYYVELFEKYGLTSKVNDRRIQFFNNENDRHIIRGYYDGLIYTRSKVLTGEYCINFYGLEDNIYQIKRYINTVLNINTELEYCYRSDRDKGFYRIKYYKEDMKTIINWLYSDCVYFDNRNYDFYKLIT